MALSQEVKISLLKDAIWEQLQSGDFKEKLREVTPEARRYLLEMVPHITWELEEVIEESNRKITIIAERMARRGY